MLIVKYCNSVDEYEYYHAELLIVRGKSSKCWRYQLDTVSVLIKLMHKAGLR
jgi:hypothetical protein